MAHMYTFKKLGEQKQTNLGQTDKGIKIDQIEISEVD